MRIPDQDRCERVYAAMEASEEREREMAHVPDEYHRYYYPGWRRHRQREAAVRARQAKEDADE